MRTSDSAGGKKITLKVEIAKYFTPFKPVSAKVIISGFKCDNAIKSVNL